MKFLVVLYVGLLLTASKASAAATHYVDSNNRNPVSPYTDWESAATNIQDAVDAAAAGDVVLVTNGVYNSGSSTATDGSMNRVVIGSAITLQSVNGSGTTAIDGGHAMRCVFLTDGAALKGLTLTNGNAGAGNGGGVYAVSTTGPVTSVLVSDCVVVSNSAASGGGACDCVLSNCIVWGNVSTGSGGGAESCILNRCEVSSNRAGFFGGGASGGITVLNNCLLFRNSATNNANGKGGGAYGATLNNCLAVSNLCVTGQGEGTYACALKNCTLYGNGRPGGFAVMADPFTAPSSPVNNSIIYSNVGANWLSLGMTNSCTTPLPAGLDNITNAPLFAGATAGDFHLTAASPCINAGRNAAVTYAADYDGNPRIVGGTVDIGAYEFPSPGSVLSYAWAKQYGLPLDGSEDFADTDGDGMNNWQEWIAGTNPTNAASLLIMLPLTNTVSGITVSWLSVTNRVYFLQRGTDLGMQTLFSIIQSNIAGRNVAKNYTDTNAQGSGPYFYRIGIQR